MPCPRTKTEPPRLAVLCVLLSLSAAARAPHVRAQAVRIDGVAALVGGDSPGPQVDTVLLSDLSLRARLALSSRDPAALAAPSHELLAATLAETVGELLIAREAERVKLAPPTERAVEREKQRLIAQAGGRERLRALLARAEATEAELEAIARRRAIVSSFLHANLEGATVVTDNAIDERLAEQRARYAGVAQAIAREQIRTELATEALRRDVERWVRVLRARVPVRLFGAFARP